MILRINIFLCLMLCGFQGSAQLGIGTLNPTNTLHAVGTLRVENTSTATTATKLMGVDATGVFNNVTAGQNLLQTGNTLEAYPTKFKITSINITSTNANHNLDFGLSGTNKDVVMFQLIYTTANFDITGIAGGTDGRHIILFSPLTNGRTLRLKAKDTNSDITNRFYLAGDITINQGENFLELIYLNGYWHQVSRY